MIDRLFVQSEDGWSLAFAGWRVSRVFHGYAPILNLQPPLASGSALSASIQFEGELTFWTTSAAAPRVISPIDAGPLFDSLVGATIESAWVDTQGSLVVRFGGGPQILVLPSDDYESWNSWASNGEGLVAEPGGTLAVWGPEPEGDLRLADLMVLAPARSPETRDP